ARVEGGDEPRRAGGLRERGGKFDVRRASPEETRADDHFHRARVEQRVHVLDRSHAAANAAGKPAADRRNQPAVVALVLCRVEIDELHFRECRELRDPALEVVRRQSRTLALHELDDASSLEIDRRYQHDERLTGTPRACRYDLSAATPRSWKWKIDAASAASARPVVKTSWKCANVPAPPDAMTGMGTADETAAVMSQSNPARVPSRSIDVSRISPAPAAAASRAQATASRPVAALPLRENTAKRSEEHTSELQSL